MKPTLGRAAAGKASAWSAVDLLGRQGVSFVVSIILARLLSPADFGAVAIATFFSSFAIAVIQSALITTIVQRHDASDAEVSSIFWWNLIASIALSALLVLVGPAVALYFDLPVLAALMAAAAVQVTLAGMGAVHVALLIRELRFGAIAKAGIPATAFSGAIGVGLAWTGAGVWALAAQLVSAAAFSSLGVWLVSGWRPAAVLRADGLTDAFGFAKWVSLSLGLETLYTQGFSLVLGKLYGPRSLGFYSRAYATQQLPGTVISGIIGRVALPLFSRRREDKEAMRRGLLAANRMAMIMSLPALVGLALTADLVIRVLFGSKWEEAAPVLSILAWAGALYPIHANNVQLLLGSGRSNVSFRIETLKKVVGIISVVAGSFFGIIGLAWSQLLFSLFALAVNAAVSQRYFNCGLKTQLDDLKGVAAATAVMAVGVVIVRRLVELGIYSELIICVGVGASLYVLAGLAFRIEAFQEFIAMSKSIRDPQPTG